MNVLPKSRILVTGAGGGLARIVVQKLAKTYDVVGVDPRYLPELKDFPGELHQIDYTHRRMTELFRAKRFDCLLHVGRVPVTVRTEESRRYHVNVMGTRNLLELAGRYGVKTAVVCSTYHVYGAHQHNHLYISEDEPLRASQLFPELVDAVELDNYARMFMLQNPNVTTVILRPANVVGSKVQNYISRLLRARSTPVLMGYDPLMQFLHEDDLAQAFLFALKARKSGVYNVAGEGVSPYSAATRVAGTRPIPIPGFLTAPILQFLKMRGIEVPKYFVDFFRYPVVTNDQLFRKEFGYVPTMSTESALLSLRRTFDSHH